MFKLSYKKIIILCICILLIVAGFYLYKIESSSFLPSDFTAQLGQDATSSGGSRYTSATLVFKQDILAEGTLTYTYSRQTITKTICTFKNNQWINQDGSLCTISFIPIPVTKKDFQSLIKTNKIKPKGDLCRHYDVCFTIDSLK